MTVMSPADDESGHEPAMCGAKKRQGEGTCRLRAGHGTDHVGTGRCRRHGGSTPSHVVVAQRQRLTDAAAIMGIPTDVEPHAAMLLMLRRAHGQEEWLADEVALLERGELTNPVGGGQGGIPEWKPHVLIGMHNAAIDRVAKIAKQCADAGVAKRMIEIQGEMAASIAQVCRAMAVALGHDPGAPEVRAAMRAALTQHSTIEGTETA
jgi:hypothetical protein